MAELTIRLRKDPETGKHDIIIDMKSDEDALPHEHEQMHRELVEKVIGKENVGKVVIERESEKAPAAPQESGGNKNARPRNRGAEPPEIRRIMLASGGSRKYLSVGGRCLAASREPALGRGCRKMSQYVPSQKDVVRPTAKMAAFARPSNERLNDLPVP